MKEVEASMSQQAPFRISSSLFDVTKTCSHCFILFPLEASKVVMQYVAAVSGKGWEVDRVKEQLLQSNPVLEGTVQF